MVTHTQSMITHPQQHTLFLHLSTMRRVQKYIHTYNSTGSNSGVSRELIRLLKIPVDSYNDILRVLQLQHYPSLLERLEFVHRKNVCCHIVHNILENETIIMAPDQVGVVDGWSLCVIDRSCLLIDRWRKF